jgi:hypothetical protein
VKRQLIKASAAVAAKRKLFEVPSGLPGAQINLKCNIVSITRAQGVLRRQSRWGVAAFRKRLESETALGGGLSHRRRRRGEAPLSGLLIEWPMPHEADLRAIGKLNGASYSWNFFR